MYLCNHCVRTWVWFRSTSWYIYSKRVLNLLPILIITMVYGRATDRRCSMAGWTTEQMRALLGLWGAADLQAQLNVVSRKKVVYQKIATYMNELGYHHTHVYTYQQYQLVDCTRRASSLARLLIKFLTCRVFSDAFVQREASST